MESIARMVDADTLEIRTPSRLHAGLLAIMEGEANRFGGWGAMVDAPAFRMTARRADRYNALPLGPWQGRAESIAQRWLEHRARRELPPIEIRLEEEPPSHFGLGSGTQFACALATILELAHRLYPIDASASLESLLVNHPSPIDLARPLAANLFWSHTTGWEELRKITMRGERSHIGLRGFLEGGFIFDRGRDPARGPTECRTTRHSSVGSWRFLLSFPTSFDTISGHQESSFFEICENSPNPHRQKMMNLIEETILPGWMQGELSNIGEAIHTYGFHAGEIFGAVQLGPYRSQEIANRVDYLRSLGIEGVCQSSWGPLVFGIVESQEKAEAILRSWDHQRGGLVKSVKLSETGAEIVLPANIL